MRIVAHDTNLERPITLMDDSMHGERLREKETDLCGDFERESALLEIHP